MSCLRIRVPVAWGSPNTGGALLADQFPGASKPILNASFKGEEGEGRGKAVIPLKLTECKVHPKLETVQYLDPSVHGPAPRETLSERMSEIETDVDR